MPYIKQNKRKEVLDNIVNLLLTELSFASNEKSRAGDITYVIYKILGYAYFAREGMRYADMALGLGILDSVRESLEDDFKRPYEKEKKKECGWKPKDIVEEPSSTQRVYNLIPGELDILEDTATGSVRLQQAGNIRLDSIVERVDDVVKLCMTEKGSKDIGE